MGRLLDCLRLDQDAFFHQHVKTQRLLSRKLFVLNYNRLLANSLQPTQLKFFDQAPLTNGLQQPGPHMTVNFDCRGYDRLGQSISLLEKCMHKCPLEQEITEETEKESSLNSPLPLFPPVQIILIIYAPRTGG